jgi:hypothetical protein
MSVQEGPSTDQRREREGAMIDRASLRLSATLLLAGQLLYILVTQFHTGAEANNHPAIFAAYARSDSWKAVHVGHFVAMAVIIAGLLVLYFGLDVRAGGAAWGHDWELALRWWRWLYTPCFRRLTVSETSRWTTRGLTPRTRKRRRASRAPRPCAGSSGG